MFWRRCVHARALDWFWKKTLVAPENIYAYSKVFKLHLCESILHLSMFIRFVYLIFFFPTECKRKKLRIKCHFLNFQALLSESKFFFFSSKPLLKLFNRYRCDTVIQVTKFIRARCIVAGSRVTRKGVNACGTHRRDSSQQLCEHCAAKVKRPSRLVYRYIARTWQY